MTGVFENLNTDMHSNQITSNSYHSLHKSQESPTLPVSTATDSSYYNSQQPGHCAGSPFDQLGSYQYHGSTTSSVPYNTKSYDLGFSSSYGAYSYGSISSPTPADTGKQTLALIFERIWISCISLSSQIIDWSVKMHHLCTLFGKTAIICSGLGPIRRTAFHMSTKHRFDVDSDLQLLNISLDFGAF